MYIILYHRLRVYSLVLNIGVCMCGVYVCVFVSVFFLNNNNNNNNNKC